MPNTGIAMHNIYSRHADTIFRPTETLSLDLSLERKEDQHVSNEALLLLNWWKCKTMSMSDQKQRKSVEGRLLRWATDALPWLAAVASPSNWLKVARPWQMAAVIFFSGWVWVWVFQLAFRIKNECQVGIRHHSFKLTSTGKHKFTWVNYID